MTRISYSILIPALIASLCLTVAAQDLPATSQNTPVSPTVPDGGVESAATSEFNAGRGSEHHPEIAVPRSKRWRMHWTPKDLQVYTRQLDFFRIELAVGGANQPLLEYVSNTSQARPSTRQGTGRAEKRLYMTWNGKGGKVADFDRKILSRAGISDKDRVLLHFYPAALENALAWLELDHAKNKGRQHVNQIGSTTFGVRTNGKRYELYVEQQEFRRVTR